MSADTGLYLMKNRINLVLIFFLSTSMASCTSFTKKNTDNRAIRLIQKNELSILSNGRIPDCRYLGEVIGTEGHWYTYIFVSNRRLVQGALNDMYNRANAMGANIVYISDDIQFVTSVTFYGQAYDCKYDDN